MVTATVGAALLLATACTAATGTGTIASSTADSTAAATASPISTAASTAAPTSLSADRPLPKLPANDLAKNSAHRLLAIDGEGFKLKVDYWTTVDSTTWDATGAKDVHLLAYVAPASGAKPPEVVIDRFSPAITLLAGNTGLTGVVAGNVVDPDGGGGATDSVGAGGSGLPGFLVTPTVSYGSQFGSAGVSEALAARWQQLAPHQALSEVALQRAGVYAVEVSMTYRLLVRNTGDAGWHRRTVVDTLTVPVKSSS